MAGDRPVAERDSAMMRRALVNAEHGWGQTAPNPMVGAVVVSGDFVVADGWHAGYGQMHGEADALHRSGKHARGATLYVTLEPCTHHGKTPPCAPAIVAAGIRRVVIAARDPNPEAGGGVEFLRTAGVEVEVGVERAAACELNAAFHHFHASDRPWITLKLAMSSDRMIAHPDRAERWITGPLSLAAVHRMRAGVDAVAVGSGTALADDPMLTSRTGPAPRRQPTRVVFDRRLRLPVTAALVTTAREVPTIVLTIPGAPQAQRDALEAAGVEVIEARSLADGLRELRRRDIRSLLVEGGAGLAGPMLAEGVVDRLAIFQSPIRLGSGGVGAFDQAPSGTADWIGRLPVVDRRQIGDDTLTVYRVRDVPCSPD